MITHKDIEYAVVIRDKASSQNKYNFLTKPVEPMQLGMNYYQAGDKIPNHYHVKRQISDCPGQEFIIVSEGKLEINLFDENQQHFQTLQLTAGDMILLLRGGHGMEILDETKIIEIKQGPYLVEGDKVIFG